MNYKIKNFSDRFLDFAADFFQRVHRFLARLPLLSKLLVFFSHLKCRLRSPYLPNLLVKSMVKGWSEMAILDLGSGPCSMEKDKRFRGVDICCVDIYQPYLKTCWKYGFKTLRADIRQIEKNFSKNSVDIIWILDVIEHLRKDDGFKLLDKVEAIARRQIIVWTPLGFVSQDASDEGNLYRQHLSAWLKEDFERRGYSCRVFPKYHRDVRSCSKKLINQKKPIPADALFAILVKR